MLILLSDAEEATPDGENGSENIDDDIAGADVSMLRVECWEYVLLAQPYWSDDDAIGKWSCVVIGKSHQEYDSVGRGRWILMASTPHENELMVPNKGNSVEEVVVSSIEFSVFRYYEISA